MAYTGFFADEDLYEVAAPVKQAKGRCCAGSSHQR